MINKQKGVGLPEIMIGLLLASLIMMGLMNLYSMTKRHYLQLQTTLDDATELQLATDLIRDSIRQAGFTPCLSINHLVAMDQRDGHENITGISSGSSQLRVNRMSSEFNLVENAPSSTQLLVTGITTLHVNQPIIIADCYHAEVQSIAQINGQIIQLSKPLAFTYQPPVYIGEWIEEQFFVRSKGGLFYHRNHTDELTPQVKTMSARLERKQSGTLVFVSLGLDDMHTVDLETKVRAQ